MAANGSHTPVTPQARRFSERTKANMRGRIEILAPRVGLSKRTHNSGSRNPVNQ